MHALCTLISANQALPNDPFSLDLTLLGQQNRPHLAFSQLNQFFDSRVSEKLTTLWPQARCKPLLKINVML
jgi:hypothetical protein